jgi:hypothetical protein
VTPEQVRAALEGDLPPATLVRGAGAWELAGALDRPAWHVTGKLDAAAAREVHRTAWLRPTGEQRVYLICLDGASAAAQNSLLKVLEEPPATTRFVLASAGRVLPTIASRCRLLPLSGTADDPAMADPRIRMSVAAAVDAARRGQHLRLAATVRGWFKETPKDAPQPRVLAAWAAEAASQRWRAFGPDFAPGVTPSEALQLLADLARMPGARLAPQVALARVFCGG